MKLQQQKNDILLCFLSHVFFIYRQKIVQALNHKKLKVELAIPILLQNMNLLKYDQFDLYITVWNYTIHSKHCILYNYWLSIFDSYELVANG